MDIFFDLNSKSLWFGSIGSADTQKVKIRQFEDLRVQFVRGTVPELLEVSATVSIRLKLTKEATTTLASTSTFTRPAASTGYYTGTLSLNTTQITTDLFDATANDDVDEMTALVEMEWAPAADATQVRKSDDAEIILVRSVVTGTESAPTEADSSASLVWLATNGIARLKDVTALTGGLTTNLDGFTSITALGSYICVDISDELQDWELTNATDATNAPNGLVRHASYATTTFERVWKRRR